MNKYIQVMKSLEESAIKHKRPISAEIDKVFKNTEQLEFFKLSLGAELPNSSVDSGEYKWLLGLKTALENHTKGAKSEASLLNEWYNELSQSTEICIEDDFIKSLENNHTLAPGAFKIDYDSKGRLLSNNNLLVKLACAPVWYIDKYTPISKMKFTLNIIRKNLVHLEGFDEHTRRVLTDRIDVLSKLMRLQKSLTPGEILTVKVTTSKRMTKGYDYDNNALRKKVVHKNGMIEYKCSEDIK